MKKSNFLALILILLMELVPVGHSYAQFWYKISSFPGNYCKTLCTTNKGSLIASTGYGTVRSTNKGDSWSGVDNVWNVNAFAIDRNHTIYAASNNGIYVSYNDGDSWSVMNTGLNSHWIVSVNIYHDSVFALTRDGNLYYYYGQNDGWIGCKSRIPVSQITCMIITSNDNIYAGSYYDWIYYLNVKTDSLWKKIPNPYFSPTPVYCLASNPNTGLFVGTEYGGIRTNNNGAQWNYFMSPATINSLFTAPNGDMYLGHGSAARSVDNGVNWYNVEKGLVISMPDWPTVISLAADSNGFIYAGSMMKGLFTTNSKFTTDAEHMNSGVSSINRSVNIFPNPFNSSAQINYFIPYPSTVTIELFNIIGVMVELLKDGPVPAGLNSYTLNAENMPSGIYFLRLRTPDNISTTKVILQK